MDNKDLEFQKRIRATFRIEAEEHLHSVSACLIELEKTRSKKRIDEIVEVIFREIHSLKGASRSVDQKDIEYVCQPLESLFSALKRKEIVLSPALIDLIYESVDWLLKQISASVTEQSETFRQSRQVLIKSLNEVISEKASGMAPEEPKASDVGRARLPHSDLPPVLKQKAEIAENVTGLQAVMARIPVSKLDPLLLQSEELIQAKIAIDQPAGELKVLINEFNQWKTEVRKRRDTRVSFTSELINEINEENESHLSMIEGRLSEITRSLERNQHSLDRLVNDHLDAVKQVLMLPVSSLVETFPAMVRQISHDQDKEIDFEIIGSELEVDKRILEEIKDPLMHLIRNSIDHGIRKPNERQAQNKTTHGKIILSFGATESGQLEIIISDDGKGINKEQVKKAAIKSAILTEEAAAKLEPGEVLDLIYQSGISTSSIITDISGHGLGLSIVKEKVLKLNGKISVESEENIGTTFRLVLPMTLATFRGILVNLNEFLFILPTLNVERVMKVNPEEIKTVENRETIRIGNHIISVADLGEVLGLPKHKRTGSAKAATEPGNTDHVLMVVLISGEERIAFKVDDLADEQQILVKGLGKLLRRVRNISGATVLGSGKLVPVLNVSDLMKSAVKINGGQKEIDIGHSVPKPGNVLVAEDSITSRTLLKNILETAGYKVITAIDGADAFTKARTGDFDIIVSDVDMPKMNGFELTAKIRNDKKLGEVPVVLVTALESREDRERGIEAGADAYIVKSSFDQSNLLDIIRKLI